MAFLLSLCERSRDSVIIIEATTRRGTSTKREVNRQSASTTRFLIMRFREERPPSLARQFQKQKALSYQSKRIPRRRFSARRLVASSHLPETEMKDYR